MSSDHSSKDPRLHALHGRFERPRQFTFPFCYTPHPMCVAAASEVQRHVDESGVLRQEHGGFSSPEEIKNISGIKEGVYSKIADSIKVN